jgi:hypothetical protein
VLQSVEVRRRGIRAHDEALLLEAEGVALGRQLGDLIQELGDNLQRTTSSEWYCTVLRAQLARVRAASEDDAQ